MDGNIDTEFRFEIFDYATNAWSSYNRARYIYMDVEIQYDYNANV